MPLPTDETVTAFGDSCYLMHIVVDVSADPKTGTPVASGGGQPLKWPKGFTAWRVGTQVEVLDATGFVVLTTGARYWMCPSEYIDGFVIGRVRPCPDCALGGGPD